MKHELYQTDYYYFKRIDPPPDEVEIYVTPINIKVASLKEVIMWNIACGIGRVKAYSIFDGDKLVHRSLVVKGRAKFRFLKSKDIEIGPCWTDEQHRGRGYYPYTLSKIIDTELSNGGTAYMIVSDSNFSSQKGIQKVGFTKTEYVVIKDSLKRYSTVKE